MFSESSALRCRVHISEPVTFACTETAPNGDRRMFQPIASTLVSGERDAVRSTRQRRPGASDRLAPCSVPDAGVGDAPIRLRTRLGVDLARIADLRDAIPDAALSAAERRRVYAADDPAAEAATLWARKEALLKALGTGLRGDPSAVETVGDPRVSDLDPGRRGLPAGFAAAIARA